MGLAERKRKQVLSVDPQNKFWKNDKNGFGYRMLLKMGWLEGQSLGVDSSGKVENIAIVRRAENLGLGANAKSRDEAFRSIDLDKLLNDVGRKIQDNIDNSAKEKSSKSSKTKKCKTELKTSRKTKNNGSVKTNPMELTSCAAIHRRKNISSKSLALRNAPDLETIFQIPDKAS